MSVKLTERPQPERRGGLPVQVETWGSLACFTRPELKVERVSYPVMTPGAAKGVLEAIFWKPEMRYDVTAIEALAPVSWISMRRNEVKSVVSGPQVTRMRKDRHLRYDVENDRVQRNTTALRDVAYRIHAEVRLAPHATAPAEKYRAQLVRRVERGACFSEPFFGTREFTASFGPVGSAPLSDAPVGHIEELGVMLHSITYTDDGEQYGWFRARMQQGMMLVPGKPLSSDAVIMPAFAVRTDAAKAE
ncbi:type I-C CRISPR-associated protein Cas5c [Streptomyces globisporus]|uniref:type I-C CRISPR-associated protein Cas5c n=1 Tax=Streptomyces globisporus TaxID=1908 RepID=UPI00345F49C9